MGVQVSKNAELSEFSLATGVIGIVSFAFTLGTFIKVVWVNLTTLGEAPHEVHSYLTNLRTELLEERASLRAMRRGSKKHQRSCRREGREDMSGMELDEVSLRTMNDAVKHLIRRFKDLEKPFLERGESGIGDATNHRTRARRRDRSASPYYNHAAYNSPPEKNRRSRSRRRSNYERERDDEDADEEAYWAQRTKYAKFSLVKRFKWLNRKNEAQYLFESLSRVQVRRIALQVGGLSMMMNSMCSETMDMQNTMQRIDQRVNRVAGNGGRRPEP